MKTPFLLMAIAVLLASCKADVHTAPAGEGDKTTLVNPPAENKVENTTVVTPPAEKK